MRVQASKKASQSSVWARTFCAVTIWAFTPDSRASWPNLASRAPGFRYARLLRALYLRRRVYTDAIEAADVAMGRVEQRTVVATDVQPRSSPRNAPPGHAAEPGLHFAASVWHEPQKVWETPTRKGSLRTKETGKRCETAGFGRNTCIP